MPNGRNNPDNAFVRKAPKGDRNRIVIEPSDEERVARDVEIQQRGGRLHDDVKIDPFAPGYKAPVARDPLKKA